MAGLGSRFSESGYEVPKPFLPMFGKTMIQAVLANLSGGKDVQATLIVNADHLGMIKEIFPEDGSLTPQLIVLDELSLGPADSVNHARNMVNLSDPMIIANSDQFVLGGIEELHAYLHEFPNQNALLTLQDDDPKWSFVELDSDGFVVRLVEKQVISGDATAGIYGFSSGLVFFEALDILYSKNDTTNGEYYVGPVYNYVKNKTKAINLGNVNERFFGLGIPEDYERFRKLHDKN
jgi:dTDP-glucose pyrophosphorylase